LAKQPKIEEKISHKLMIYLRNMIAC